METNQPGQAGQYASPNYYGQQSVPNSTGVLVLGIMSIVCCWCYGIIGLILGIIALVLAGKAKSLYEANPGAYTPGSYKNLNAGRICAFVGVALSSIYVLIILIYVMVVGVALFGLPLQEMMRH